MLSKCNHLATQCFVDLAVLQSLLSNQVLRTLCVCFGLSPGSLFRMSVRFQPFSSRLQAHVACLQFIHLCLREDRMTKGTNGNKGLRYRTRCFAKRSTEIWNSVDLHTRQYCQSHTLILKQTSSQRLQAHLTCL